MTPVLGIDIGAKFVVAFCLSELPVGIAYKDYYRKNAKLCLFKIRLDNKKDESSFRLDAALELLELIKPTAIVMEPTGVWYSRLWSDLAERLGIEVKWIGHGDLAFNRGAYGFEDKDDRTDAFCLALSYFDPVFNARKKWLFWRTGIIAQANTLMLGIKSLQSTTKILKQQIRQRLKYEFPEVAGRSITNARCKHGYTAWMGYIAGTHTFKTIKDQHDKSIATALGIEISQYTRDHAISICRDEIRDGLMKAELMNALLSPIFDRYRATFQVFEFGTMMQACILTQVYPFEKFLLNGRLWVDRYEDDQKQYKKNRSLAGFQLSLGMGKRLRESGSKSEKVFSGSSYARRELYDWSMKNVLPEKMKDSWLVQELDRRSLSSKQKSLTVAQLRKRWQDVTTSPRDRHMAGARSAMTINYRVTRLLFEELLKEFTS